MKKIIVFLFCISICYLVSTFNDNNFINENNSIRFRIIASDNSLESQALKYQIRDDLKSLFATIQSNNLNETRVNIQNNMEKINEIIDKYNISYKINYGNNYFPQKEYNNEIYDAGYYESLVITLGDASGDNWWCFMYPPLCLLDANKDNIENNEYTFLFKEIMNNLK